MQKSPVNKSLSWELLAAGSPLLLFAAASGLVLPGMLQQYLPALLRLAAMGCLGTAGVMAAHDYISASPVRQLKVALENCGIYVQHAAGIRLPKLKKQVKRSNGLHLIYELPSGLCLSDFETNRERLEQALNGELSFRVKSGLLHVSLLFGEIPEKVDFALPEFPEKYALPITIGYSRAGLEIADLAEFPHLLVAGQTYGGKSVFLHQLIACLLQNQNCKLFVIDLAKVEFAYLRRHAWCGFTVQGAHEILACLVQELDRRLDLLERAGVEKVQNYPGGMPYLVLVIDEFSNLSPQLSKYDSSKDKKALREECHSMLVDLLCRARKVGIHVVISSQRPDKDVLPGQMKANIPASVVFQVRNKVNSQICLDNDRAASLPGIRGRAIYQFDREREIQVMHLPPARARALLPAVCHTYPLVYAPASKVGYF